MAEQNKDIQFFFPTVVQETMVENHEALNRSLLAAIARLRETTPGTVPGAWACELYTTLVTNSLLHRTPEFAPLVEHIQTNAERFARFLHFNLDQYRLSIINCWVNVYAHIMRKMFMFIPTACSAGSTLSKCRRGLPGSSSARAVEDTMIHAPLTEPSFANALTHEVQAVEGKTVFFRSFVRHSVRPNPVEGERVSIAFNLTA